mmetsp:Transcript_52422/g.125243  ORF Transcript_52422/g.125243 Transcript_52422/m.125243 type:complete len:254 (-) Transcript_52422:707-1468(-)
MVGFLARVLLGDAHLHEQLRTHLENLPLHGIHASRVIVGDVEVLVVEHLNPFHEAHVLHVDLKRLPHGIVRLVVEVVIEAQQRKLSGCVQSSHEPSLVAVVVVAVRCEPGLRRLHAHKVLRWRQRAQGVRSIQKLDVADVVAELKLEGRAQEARCHHHHLIPARRREGEVIRSVEHKGVRSCSKLNSTANCDRQSCRLLDRVQWLQENICFPRPHAPAGLQDLPPPCAQEITQRPIISDGWRILLLFLIAAEG